MPPEETSSRAANMAPLPERLSESVISVEMSDMVLLWVVLLMVLPLVTGFPDGRECVPEEFRAASRVANRTGVRAPPTTPPRKARAHVRRAMAGKRGAGCGAIPPTPRHLP